MTCTHRLGDSTGLLCTVVGEHVTHVYVSSSAPDLHDESEQRAESERG